MTLFDFCVAGIVGFCLVFGGFRGLIREVSGIIGIVAGFYGANTYFPLLMPHVEPWISSPGIRKLACFFALFCLILVAVGLVAWIIRKLLKLVFLGWVDRTFGVAFGAAKGILITTVLFIMATTFIPDSKTFFAESKTAPYLARVADALTVFVSRNMKNDFNRHLEGLKKTWKQ
ncbi:MAG: CvpA family protein [Desulfobacter sp.]|nr:MAG: CvpA family protein [Desulfobacter sp.]